MTASGGDLTVDLGTLPATVDLDRPCLRLEALSSQLLVPHGFSSQTQLLLGYDTEPADATLTVEFPDGFALGPRGISLDDNIPLGCNRDHARWSCQIDADQLGDHAVVDVAADASDSVGMTRQLTASLDPVGITDAHPENNTATVPLTVQGVADLDVGLSTPASLKVPANHTITVTATISNTGPDTATGLYAKVVFGAKQRDLFRVSGPSGAWPAETVQVRLPLPDLTAGGSVRRSSQVTGLQSGAEVFFIVFAGANTFDPHVPCDAAGCDTVATTKIDVTAGAAAPGPSGGATTHTTGSTGTSTTEPLGEPAATEPSGDLAATGTPALPLALAGFGLLLAGGAVTLTGRRRGARRTAG